MDVHLITFLFPLVLTLAKATRVLVLGGNGFMGAATVKLLLEENLEVTVTSRGSLYWDQGPDPRVRQVLCDRYADVSLEQKCPKLYQILISEQFHYIVDFSCYDGKSMEKIVSVLNKNFEGVYVYISSDSVYEVCERRHINPSSEDDAPCQSQDNLNSLLQKADDYGRGKLDAENVLTSSNFAYVILRLPDVIGPRDSLHRLWRYLIWMQVASRLNKPVPLPSFYMNRPMSLVYVHDVAQIVTRILTSTDKETVLNQSYNIAFDEQISLYRLLEMARNYQTTRIHDDVRFLVDHTSGYYLFPSVNLGAMNTDKAVRVLKWRPTPLHEAVKTSVEFFEEVMKDRNNPAFKWNKDRVIARLVQGPFRGMEEQLRAAIDDIYTRTRKDEL